MMSSTTVTLARPIRTIDVKTTTFLDLNVIKTGKIELENRDPFVFPPEFLVDVALTRLSHVGVQLIEWGAMLYRRMDVPVIPKVC